MTRTLFMLLILVAASGGMLGLCIAAWRLENAVKENKALFPLSSASWLMIGTGVFAATALGLLLLDSTLLMLLLGCQQRYAE